MNRGVLFALGIMGVSCAVAQVVQRVQHPYSRQISITLRLDKERYFRMEPVMGDLSIKNTGTQPVKDFFGLSGRREPLLVTVKNYKGLQLANTALGKAAIEQSKTYMGGSEPLDTDLHSGQELKMRIAINEYADVTNYYDAGNGKYSVQIERYGAHSDIATFEIRPQLFDLQNAEVQELMREDEAAKKIAP